MVERGAQALGALGPDRRRRGFLALAAVALVAAAAGVGVAASGVLSSLEQASVGARFEQRHVERPRGIVVVAIDDASFATLRQQWPFPRSLHARAIDRLRAAGAKEIVYDVQFTEPTQPREDLALYNAVARAGNVVLATTDMDRSGHTQVLGGDANLSSVGARAAASTLVPQGGGDLTRYAYSVSGLETIGVAGAARGGGVALLRSSFPASGARIDYRGGPGTFPTVGFADLVRGRVSPQLLRGKIVVVGASASTLQDLHPTPTSRHELMSGAEVQANAIWTALHANPLRDAPGWLGTLAIALLALLVPLLRARLSLGWTLAGAAVGGAAYLVAAQLAFDGGLVVEVVAPCVALLVGTVGGVVASFLGEHRDRRILSRYGALLERTVEERTARLHESQIEIVRRLAEASESRDPETGEHIERISEMCRRLASAAGVADEEAELIGYASTLHDLGKIAIPDRILLKPDKLDPDEWEIMKTHAAIGSSMLSGSHSELVQLAEAIALTHHERWDGTGYPTGLRGDEIPLPGRICAICDVYDALRSKRPYKGAWSLDDTLEEIARCSGTQFDPRLVDVFLEMVRSAELPERGLEYVLA
ncbi:MAG: CHASE2 domain-containing protein [Thermoleophilaceae bacterium]